MANKDRLTEAHERLTAAVESLVSGEDWQQLLSLAARLHRYSTGAGGVFELRESLD